MTRQPIDHKKEINGIFYLAMAVILAVTYFLPAQKTGWLGRILRNGGHGLLGVAAWALPVLFLYMTLDYILESELHVSRLRFTCVLILLASTAALLHLLTVKQTILQTYFVNPDGELSALQALKALWRTGVDPALLGQARAWTGGLVGGILAQAFLALAGPIGADILCIALMLAMMILLFNVSYTHAINRTAQAIQQTGGRVDAAVRSTVANWRETRAEVQRPEPAASAECAGRGKAGKNLPARPADPAGANQPFSAPATRPLDHFQYDHPLDAQPADQPADISGQPADPADLDPATKSKGALADGWRNFWHSRKDDPGSDSQPPGQTAAAAGPAQPGRAADIPSFLQPSAPRQGGFMTITPPTAGAAADQPDPLQYHIPGSQPTNGAAGNQAGDSGNLPAFLAPSPPAPPPTIQPGSPRPAEPAGPGAASAPGQTPPASQADGSAATGAPGPDALDEADPNGPRKVARDPAAPGAEAPANDHFGRGHWTDRSAVPPPEIPTTGQTNGPHAASRPGIQLAIQVPFETPPVQLLREDNLQLNARRNQGMIQALGTKLETTLASFGIEAHVINFTTGPTITRFELTPGPGVKVSRIVNLADDIALNLAAMGVRIEAPIPGKSAIGIEIPNKETTPVLLRGLIESPEFTSATSALTAAIGRDIQGNPILCDLAKMPHLLIAGATGSGKSVCINAILISILFKANPEKVKLLMIDPKVVELNVYNGIPHLLQPVVTDPKKAAGLLMWAVNEMVRRYGLFAEKAVRDVSSYNASLGLGLEGDEEEEPLPLILLVIDELSDLMATTPAEVEDAIARLTAMARAAGIHLIIATQRPSVDVITGVIKANIPSRVAFAVASQVDSRTILDMAGAEKLLGKGDMLYYPQSAAKPIRGQGAFVTDAEVESVISFIKTRYPSNYDQRIAEAILTPTGNSKKDEASDQDELLPQALRICVETGYASVSLLQRRMTVGYPRAARLIDRMHELGYIGGFEGSKPRKVIITMPQLMEMLMKENASAGNEFTEGTEKRNT